MQNNTQVLDQLVQKGIFPMPPICDEQTGLKLKMMWESLAEDLIDKIDLENTHVLVVFSSESRGHWPPAKNEIWPGYKQKTSYGNLRWETTEAENFAGGLLYKIELLETPSTFEYIYYPSEEKLGKFSDVITEYQEAESRIIASVFPKHKATFCCLTYLAGNCFLPPHTDGDVELNTARIVHTIENTRDHTLVVDDHKYLFKKGDSYLFNAFHKHELKASPGHRLTISSCIIEK